MMDRILNIIKLFALWVVVFALQKPLFMAYNHSLYRGTGMADWLAVVWHGLPLDLSVAAALTVVPALLLIASVWSGGGWWRKLLFIYYMVVSLLVAFVFVLDLLLHSYWGIRIDALSLSYFFTFPADMLAPVGWGVRLMALLLVFFLAAFIYLASLLPSVLPPLDRQRRLLATAVMALLVAALAIPIRGGLSKTPVTTSCVYFSDNMLLNAAAINPVFNVVESWRREQDLAGHYRPGNDAGECFEDDDSITT